MWITRLYWWLDAKPDDFADRSHDSEQLARAHAAIRSSESRGRVLVIDPKGKQVAEYQGGEEYNAAAGRALPAGYNRAELL